MATMATAGTMPNRMTPMPTTTCSDVMQKTPAATRQTANAMREAMGERLGFSTGSLPALAMRSS